MITWRGIINPEAITGIDTKVVTIIRVVINITIAVNIIKGVVIEGIVVKGIIVEGVVIKAAVTSK